MTRPGTARRVDNVTPMRPGIEGAPSPFDRLTARLVMERHRAGTLDAGIVAALLAAVGLTQ